jgi:hypothetical protein
MEDQFKKCLWQNFGAAIVMLTNAIELCPDQLWKKELKFFYIAYHTTIFLDYYLTVPVTEFKPKLPYYLADINQQPPESVDDVIPKEHYSQGEMLSYLSEIREKCKKIILTSTEEKLSERWIEDLQVNLHGLCPSIVENYTVLEILFYNFRHLQHHVAQLNLILRQKINFAPNWVSHVD